VACPVPLHPRRLRQRGFNQALELLRSAAKIKQLPIQIACNAIARTVDTPTLGHGSALQRSRVVAGAFAVTKPKQISGRRILVVDDVMTTGATLSECTRTLLSAGAKEVRAVTLARAL
jgi:competence protein ComFC